MSSTFTPNILELQGFNENSTTWGLRDNTTFSKIDNMIHGWLVKDLSAQIGVYILTALQSQLDEQSMSGFRFQGLLTADIIIRIPAVAQQHVYWNDTTGGFNLNIGPLNGTPYKLPPGARAIVRCDGSVCFDNINFINGNLTVLGTTTIGVVNLSSLTTTGNASIAGTATVGAIASGNAAVTGTLSVSGATTLGSLAVTSAATVGSSLAVTGPITAASSLAATGSISTTGNLISSQGTFGTNGTGSRFISVVTPTGGTDGDIWLQIT